MNDCLVRFVDENGKQVLGAGLLPRHLKPGDIVTDGGTMDSPTRRFEVMPLPFKHHNQTGVDGRTTFITTVVVRPL